MILHEYCYSNDVWSSEYYYFQMVYKRNSAGMVGAVSKISALQPEGPRFDPDSAEIWIFVRPSFLPKPTQLSILLG